MLIKIVSLYFIVGVEGTEPNRALYVSWISVRKISADPSNSFQCVMFENSSTLVTYLNDTSEINNGIVAPTLTYRHVRKYNTRIFSLCFKSITYQ